MTHPVIFSLFVSFLKICACEFRNHLRRTWDYFFLRHGSFSLYHFAFFLWWPRLCSPPRLPVAVPFLPLFLPDCFSLFLLWCSFLELLLLCLSCLLAFILFSLSLSLVFFFSLSSSACLPALALTGGYSSLGWAETASLYNTDRLLCNQIPSVATSEDSLSRFLHRAHTQARTQAHAHTPHLCFLLLNIVCAPVCVCMRACMVYVQWPVYLQSFHLIHSWPAERKPLESLSLLPVFSTDPAEGSKVIVFRYPCLFCVSARPWLPYHTGDSGL